MKKAVIFHKPIHPKDTETQTVGCRLTNPNTCGKNRLPTVCAFSRSDGICSDPPKTWPAQFKRLKYGDLRIAAEEKDAENLQITHSRSLHKDRSSQD